MAHTNKTFEKLKRADTVQVVPITKEKKIVLTKQEQPGGFSFTGVLGGRVDFNEEILAAANWKK